MSTWCSIIADNTYVSLPATLLYLSGTSVFSQAWTFMPVRRIRKWSSVKRESKLIPVECSGAPIATLRSVCYIRECLPESAVTIFLHRQPSISLLSLVIHRNHSTQIMSILLIQANIRLVVLREIIREGRPEVIEEDTAVEGVYRWYQPDSW